MQKLKDTFLKRAEGDPQTTLAVVLERFGKVAPLETELFLLEQDDAVLQEDGYVVGYVPLTAANLVWSNQESFNNKVEIALDRGLLEDINYELAITRDGVQVRVVALRAQDDD